MKPMVWLGFVVVLCGALAWADDWNGTAVEHRGALRNIVHNGDVSAVVDLESLAEIEGLYALGAGEGLRGEIVILDGRPFTSSVSDGEMVMDTSFRGKATLLVYAQVLEWQEHDVPPAVSTGESLTEFVTATAEAQGISVDEPFPFLIKGRFGLVEWHVVDWPPGDTVHTHDKHKASGLSGWLEDTTVTILGFYSSKHHGVFTHHTTNVHMHMVTADERLAGHVDSLSRIGPVSLWLPKL